MTGSVVGGKKFKSEVKEPILWKGIQYELPEKDADFSISNKSTVGICYCRFSQSM